MSTWAIVTGASGGIGAVFVRDLVKRGHRVLAVARRRDALENLGDDVEPLAADLATPEGVAAVVARAKEIDVEMLVNNAGVSTQGSFLEQDGAKELASIKLNVEALYSLTRGILPILVKKKRGGIINIASVVGFQAIPYWTTYSATKAFVLAFGEGVAYEMKGTGVKVITVCPGFTKTDLYAAGGGMPGRAGRLLPSSDPQDVVDAALAAFRSGSVIRVVGVLNRVAALFGALLPRPVSRAIMAFAFAPTTDERKSLPPPT
jgi:uncharacterized protein